MATFTLRCGWCGSKDQTADVVAYYTHTYLSYGTTNRTEFRLSVNCRKCRNYSQVVGSRRHDLPDRFKKFVSDYSAEFHGNFFGEVHDITDAFGRDYNQVPSTSVSIAPEIPASVRESLLDAAEARSPRAKCQSFRTALEFALREANVAVTPGKTLGALLTEAKKNLAIPDALIELCDQVKAFGNWGLHWAEAEIVDDDAVAAGMISKAVLDYLFVLPAEVVKAKARTSQANTKHQKGAKP